MTYDSWSVESILEGDYELLVLVTVIVEDLHSSTEQVDLSLVVGQLLVLSVDLLAIFKYRAIGLLQSETNQCD